jgi:hypothetical protein
MTTKITAYTALAAPNPADVTVAVDTSDTTMAASGTTKAMSLATMAAFIAGGSGLQLITDTSGTVAFGANAGTVTATTIANAIAAGYSGLFLDPRYIWDLSGLQLNPANFPAGIQNFVIKSWMKGTIGWTGGISYPPGYITTATGTPADGIQIYGAAGAEMQGIEFRDCAIAGPNSRSVVHLGGRQRRVGFPGTFIYNTNATQTTVASGSNTVNVSTFAGAGTLNVASSASFASAGNVVVATSLAMATLSYTGKGTGTLTGVKTLGGAGTLSTGGVVGQAAFGLQVDTGLSDFNSENSQFGPQMNVAGGNVAIGIGINDQTQKCNDSLFDDTVTAAGLAALVAVEGSNLQFTNYYDRSSPALCTVANHGGGLIFIGGEAYNPSGGPHELLNTSGAATSYVSRLLTAGASTTQILNAGGRFRLTGRGVLNGTCAMSSSASLGVADSGSDVSGLTVTGSSGSVYRSSQYVAGNSGPAVGGFSGTLFSASWTSP